MHIIIDLFRNISFAVIWQLSKYYFTNTIFHKYLNRIKWTYKTHESKECKIAVHKTLILEWNRQNFNSVFDKENGVARWLRGFHEHIPWEKMQAKGAWRGGLHLAALHDMRIRNRNRQAYRDEGLPRLSRFQWYCQPKFKRTKIHLSAIYAPDCAWSTFGKCTGCIRCPVVFYFRQPTHGCHVGCLSSLSSHCSCPEATRR